MSPTGTKTGRERPTTSGGSARPAPAAGRRTARISTSPTGPRTTAAPRPATRRPATPAPRRRPEPVIEAAAPHERLHSVAGRAANLVAGFLDRTTPPRRRALEAVPEKVTRARTGRRLRWLFVALVALFGLIGYKLAAAQVISPQRYAAFGESQRVRTQTLAADRGTITDRNGTPLALSLPTKSVFVDPKLVEDPRGEAQRLAEVLGLDAGDIEQKMTAPNRFGYIARQIPDDEAERIVALKEHKDDKGKVVDLLPGVAFVEEPKRYLPSGEVAKSIVGQVDIDGQGLSGLEKMYADQLTGTPGKLVLEQNPNGHTIAPGDTSFVPASPGEDLELTIDRSMQYETERILGEQVRDAGAKGGIAIVMKPDTGEILSVANMVSDPETGEVGPGGNNAAFTTVYEPGSVMKMVTAAGAIEQGKVTPDTPVVVPDTLQICDSQFSEHDYHGTVSWPVSKIISQSSNTGTIKLAQMLGKDQVYRYLRDFGFGQRTAVNFPNEQTGELMSPDQWWCSSMGTIPIGQGVSVTPLQMLTAYNAIANGGVYVAPRLVNATTGADGVRRPVAVDPGRRVVSKATADQLNVMLRDVVVEGTGTKAAIDGYHPAGKTGTARKPQPGGGYYGPDGIVHYQATFVGFVPAEAPELGIIVIIDDPSKEGIYGGVVAAPAFSKIAETALRHFNIPPPAVDLVTGGAPVEDDHEVRKAASVDPETGIETTADGRVRGPAAGERSASTTVPGAASGLPATGTPPTTAWKPPATSTPTTAWKPPATTVTTKPSTTVTTRKPSG